jgi:hypothetical protein
MSHTNSLMKTLNELKASGAFPQRLLMRDPSVAATVEMDVHKLDSLSIQLSLLRVSPEATTKVVLKEKAADLALRITGLLEKLSVIEIDDNRGEALLRSNSPAVNEEERLYYELIADRQGTATLHRYQGSMLNSKRKEVPFILTREALAKLITDLVG